MTECIFCKIINGDIPSHKVFENDDILAFLDITQVTKGHTLVIPKKHVANVFEWTPDVATAMGQALPLVANALQRAFPSMAGLNMVNNNGELAYQTVFHSHVHLLPRYSKEDSLNITFASNMSDYDHQDMAEIAKSIQTQFDV